MPHVDSKCISFDEIKVKTKLKIECSIYKAVNQFFNIYLGEIDLE